MASNIINHYGKAIKTYLAANGTLNAIFDVFRYNPNDIDELYAMRKIVVQHLGGVITPADAGGASEFEEDIPYSVTVTLRTQDLKSDMDRSDALLEYAEEVIDLLHFRDIPNGSKTGYYTETRGVLATDFGPVVDESEDMGNELSIQILLSAKLTITRRNN